MNRRMVAVDLGASGGKMACGSFDGNRLIVEELVSFSNRPVNIGTALYWDVFSLFNSIVDGLKYFSDKYGNVETMGIDTWGATYGLLDFDGRLLEPVYHYRDLRTKDIMGKLSDVMEPYELFKLTGCQCNSTYTLPQLYSYISSHSKLLEFADKMLFLPDLLGYFLTGIKSTELTIAGTSCLLNGNMNGWSLEVSKAFGITDKIFTKLVQPGSAKGYIRNDVAGELSIQQVKLISVIGHDSASAVAAIPNFKKGDMYISVGTNISMGTESKNALITLKAFESGLKNTAGFLDSTIIYRDFSACWHINEFLRTCREEGQEYSFDDLNNMVSFEKCCGPWIDVEDILLNTAGGNFKEKINIYMLKSNQKKLKSDSEFIQCIYESIALKVRHYMDEFRENGVPCEEIFVISGATKNKVLMQYIANAIGMNIKVGMPNATLAGNLLTQLYSENEIESFEQLRTVSSQSFKMTIYEPQNSEEWNGCSKEYRKIINSNFIKMNNKKEARL